MAVAVSATTRTAGYPIRIVGGNRGGPVVVACPSACRRRGAGHWACTGSDYLQAGTLSYLRLVDRGWSIALYFLGFPIAGCVLRRTGAVHFSGFLCCILATSTSTSRGSAGCSAHLFGRPVFWRNVGEPPYTVCRESENVCTWVTEYHVVHPRKVPTDYVGLRGLLYVQLQPGLEQAGQPAKGVYMCKAGLVARPQWVYMHWAHASPLWVCSKPTTTVVCCPGLKRRAASHTQVINLTTFFLTHCILLLIYFRAVAHVWCVVSPRFFSLFFTFLAVHIKVFCK